MLPIHAGTHPSSIQCLPMLVNFTAMERVEGYTVVYRQAEDIIVAEVPAIPGCFSDGQTLEEARERVRDAILNFLEDLEEAGEEVPPDVLHVERVLLGAA